MSQQLKCKLCETEFKTEALLDTHLSRKTACISAKTVIEMLEKNENTMKEAKERMVTYQESSDMFRNLHVRTQKQLQVWRREHAKCSVTIEKNPPEEEYTGPRQTMSVAEFFDNAENNPAANDIFLPEGARRQAERERAEAAAAIKDSTAQESPKKRDLSDSESPETSPIKGSGEGTTNDPFKFGSDSSKGNSFSFGNTGGSGFSFKQPSTLKDPDSISTPTNWSSWSSKTNNNPTTVSTSWSSSDNGTTRTSTNGSSVPTGPGNAFPGTPAFGTPEWTKQFTNNAPWNNKRPNQVARLPNGQVVDTTNMTTTNTTTTNITNNIVNINVKLCAPGFESIHITDSRALNFNMEKKQRIADHLQKLVEIMMDEPVPKYN